jgi:hypothetical protein
MEMISFDMFQEAREMKVIPLPKFCLFITVEFLLKFLKMKFA